MTNKKYYQLIDKIKKNIAKNGVSKAIIDDLKLLREMVVAENQPLLAKIIRLTFQHIETNDTFNIAIPKDEPIEGFESVTEADSRIIPVESLDYLLSNMQYHDKKINESDIRAFVADLQEQAR